MPGYVRNYEQLRSNGVEVLACVSVNDAYVMAAWEKEKGATGKMHMLADTNGEFTKVIASQSLHCNLYILNLCPPLSPTARWQMVLFVSFLNSDS